MGRVVYLKDYGVLPDTGENYIGKINELFKQFPSNAKFVFEKGVYTFKAADAVKADYRLSNTDVIAERSLALLMKDMRSVTVDFNHAEFIFHGQMQPITVDSCENISLENLVIDWDKPLVSEGIVVAQGERYLDLHINPELYPHIFKDGALYFNVGNDEYSKYWAMMMFDATTRTVTAKMGDRFDAERIEPLQNHTYRFHFGFEHADACYIGNICVLRHNERIHAAAFIENSANVSCDDITVHSCGGLGVLAQFNENLSFTNVKFIPNTKKGRLISSGHDDGFHLTSNRGEIVVDKCVFIGLMDDPINVHGCSVSCLEFVNSRTVRCKFEHHQAQGFLYWANSGHEISFIDKVRMNSIGRAFVESYTLESFDTFTLRFDDDIPRTVLERTPAELASENLTNTSALICTNNHFGSCRARGILISTPKRVLIKGNIFDSSGTAILVAGDANDWYESGECHDVTIQDNVFTDHCLSTMYQFCEGIISICPAIPAPDIRYPFHKNIKIEDNTFYTPENPVLYAISTDNLIFSGNRIIKSYRTNPWHPNASMIKLEFCINSHIENNNIIGDFQYLDVRKHR